MATLYRKYRPRTFSEISGQEYVLQTLTNAIRNNRFGHAYLFTGPRGTGKTTTARIFAKTINCLKPLTKTKKSHIKIEPCNKCKNCQIVNKNQAIDIIEIDAASHTGVDNIRQLKEAIDTPPSHLRYKVYIIDEVHMLSLGAFNALLKTLEEPPQHTIFILATTELHKVPETIISRCQQFNIKPLTKEEIIKKLSSIAKKEKIKLDKEALNLIATEANGGMRDAESLLDQLISLHNRQEINDEDVRHILGLSSRQSILKLTEKIAEKDLKKTLEIINNLEFSGTNLKSFTQQLLNFMHDLLLFKTTGAQNEILQKQLTAEEINDLEKLAKKFSLPELLKLTELIQQSLEQSNYSEIPQLSLEMAVLKFQLVSTSSKKEENSSSEQDSKKKVLSPQKKKNEKITKNEMVEDNPVQPKKTPGPKRKSSQASTEKESTQTPESESDKTIKSNQSISINQFLQQWNTILDEVNKVNRSLFAFLSVSIPQNIQDGSVWIKTKFSFHQEQLSKPENKLTIEKVFARILRVPLRVRFIVDETKTEEKSPTTETIPKTEKPSTTEKETAPEDDSLNSQQSAEENLLYEALRQVGGRIVE